MSEPFRAGLALLGLVAALTGSAGEARALETTASPKFAPPTVRLFDDHAHIQKNKAPDYWALSGYYLAQEGGAYCSVATVAMIVNAARARTKLTASDELATQTNLLKKVKTHDWAQKVGALGRGVGLGEFAPILSDSLKAYGVEVESTEVVVVDADDARTRKKIREILTENEKSDRDLIAVNYLQSEYTGDPEGKVGHFAPVAAYDAVKKRVLIFDPDRQYYEPYWVSEDAFVKGMMTLDPVMKSNRGLVRVRMKR